LEGIHAWKPDNGSPCQIEPEMVVAHINSPEVPIFVDEEIDDVDSVECGGNDDGFGDEPMELVLICDEGDVAGSINYLCHVMSLLSRYSEKEKVSRCIISRQGS